MMLRRAYLYACSVFVIVLANVFIELTRHLRGSIEQGKENSDCRLHHGIRYQENCKPTIIYPGERLRFTSFDHKLARFSLCCCNRTLPGVQ